MDELNFNAIEEPTPTVSLDDVQMTEGFDTPVAASERTATAIGTLAGFGAQLGTEYPDETYNETKRLATNSAMAGDYDQAVAQAADNVNKRDRASQEEALKRMATSGDVNGAVAMANSMTTSIDEFNNSDYFTKLSVIARANAEFLATGKPGIWFNNTNQKIENRTTDSGEALSAGAVIYNLAEDARTNNTVTASVATFVRDLIPGLSLGASVEQQRVLERYTQVDRSIFNSAQTVNDMKTLLAITPEKHKAGLVYSLWNDLEKSNLTSTVENAELLSALVDSDAYFARMDADDLNIIFTGIDLGGVFGTVIKGGRAMAMARKKASLPREMSATGGSDTTGRVIASEIENPGPNSLGQSKREQHDSATSMSVSRYTGDNVSGTSAQVQETLIANTEKLLDNLRSALVVSGRTPQETSDALKNVMKTYDPAVNKSVYGVDVGSELTGDRNLTVHYQSFTGRPYVSREAAQAAGETRFGSGFEVVPAKSNSEWVIARSEIQALEKELADLKAATPSSKPRFKWSEVFGKEATDDVLQQRAVHGTSVDFDTFDFARNTRSAVGHGGYFSMDYGVAEGYARAAMKRQQGTIGTVRYGGKTYRGSRAELDQVAFDLKDDGILDTNDYDFFMDMVDDAIMREERRKPSQAIVYDADIPESNKLMAWEGRMSEQAPEVASVLKSLVGDLGDRAVGEDYYRALAERLGSDQAASEALNARGVLGHTYDAAYDAPAGIKVPANTMNFVVYSPDSVTLLGKDFAAMDKVYAQKALGTYATSLERYAAMVDKMPEQTTVFTDNFPVGLRAGMDKLMKELGLDDKVRVITDKDIQAPSTKQAAIIASSPRYKAALVDGAGFYDQAMNVIFIKTVDATPADIVNTMTHELAHHAFFRMFDIMPELRPRMAKEFNSWIATRHPDMFDSEQGWAQYVFDFRSPREGLINIADEFAEAQAWGGPSSVGREFNNIVNTTKQAMRENWYLTLDEWLAENVTKWYSTSQRGQASYADKFGKAVVDAITRVVDAVKRIFGIETAEGNFVSGVPENFEQFMNNWLDNAAAADKPILPSRTSDYGRVWKQMEMPPPVREQEKRILDIQDKLDAAYAAERDLTGGWLLKRKEFFDSIQDIGKFTDEDINSISFIAADPLHGTSKFLYEERLVGVHAEAKIRKALGDFVKEPWDKLNGKQKTEVESVLREGDAYSNNGGLGKEFNNAELVGKGLTPQQIEAYYTSRVVRNVMHELRDQRMAASLREQGYEKLTITFKTGGDVFESAGKRVGWNDYIGKTVWNAKEDKAVRVSREMIDKELTDGNILVTTAETVERGGAGAEFNAFIVPEGSIKSSPITTVIPKRPGEYARIYDESFFIETNVVRNINDTKVADKLNIRTAATRQEAEMYVSAMNDAVKLFRAGELDVQRLDKLVGKWEDSEKLFDRVMKGEWDNLDEGAAPFSFHFNRMEDDYIRDFSKAAVDEGRLFTSKRGQRLSTISSITQENILSPLKSLQAEITNISRLTTISEWRDTAIARWFNTFRDVLPIELQNKTPQQAFFSMSQYKFTSTSQRGIAAERVYKYVTAQIGTPTREEEFFKGVTKQMVERFTPDGKLGATVGGFLRHASPTAFLRTISFHTMLGMFNPAQLLVQSVGALTAVAIHPLHGLAAAKTAPLLRIALMSDNPAVWRSVAVANKYAGLGIGSIDEFERTVKAIRKTGIIDGINSTSLYNIEDGRFNVFSKTIRKAGEGSAFFFNRGEEFARLVGFDVARREWQKKNPGRAWDTDNALREILQRQDSFTQNMTKANENMLQRGMLSVPTQFLQYNIKLGMNLAGAATTGMTNAVRAAKGLPPRDYRGFTPREAASVLLANYVAWGFANNGTPNFIEEWIAGSVQDWSDEQRLYVTQGLFSGMLNTAYKALTNEELALAGGKRFNALQWYEDLAKAATSMFTGESEINPAELALGASYSSMARLGAFGKQFYLWYQDPDLSAEDFTNGLRFLATESIVTLKNADKAYLAYNTGFMYDPKGNKVARASHAEAIAQFLSVPTAEVADYYKIIENKQGYQDRLKSISKHYVDLQREWYRASNTGDLKRAKDVELAMSALIGTMPPSDWQFVTKEARNNVLPYDTALEREIYQYNTRALTSAKSAAPLVTNMNVNETKLSSKETQ